MEQGCTATVALVIKKKIYCANAGDSRTIIYQNEKTVELSKDHKPNELKEKNRILNAGGTISRNYRVNGSLAVSRAIGDFEYKKNEPPKDVENSWFLKNHPVTSFPDITVKALNKNIEFMVLACDGIWDCLTSQEVCEYFKNEIIDGDIDIKESNHNILDKICPKTIDELDD